MSGATANKDGTRKKWLHGRAVLKGELRFLSVSSLEKGDSSKSTGCLRRWHYQYIGGLKEEQSDAMAKGEKLHAEIAEYLQTGRKVLSSQVMAGMHMIPDPGDDLLVEHDIVPSMPDGTSGLKHAVLKASGIPIVGAIDLIHARGINKGGSDIEATIDPPGTIEVIDWKTCRTLGNIKQGPELIKSIQMVGYGKYIFDAEPEAKLVRLSHGYFPSQGSPRKTTIRVDRDQIEKSWEHSNRVASSIRDAAKETNPDLIEANTQACRAYGKDCPALKVCTAAKSRANNQFVLIPTGNLTKSMSNNGILAQIKAKQANSNLPEPRESRGVFGNVGVKVTPSATKAEATVEITLDDEVEKLKVEMERLKKLEEASKIEKDEMPEILPPDAPESDPVLASKPMTDNTFTMAMDAHVEIESPALPVEASEPVEVVVEKKKRGRKPKTAVMQNMTVEGQATITTNAETVIVENNTIIPQPANEESAAKPYVPEPGDSGPINLFVNCTVDGMDSESLWPVIEHIHSELNKAANALDSNVRDFRAHKDMDYGHWKIVLAAAINATYFAGGNYTLDDAHSDIGQVVVEAMRSIVRKSGGVLVKGIR
jgi:hypothetical protein